MPPTTRESTTRTRTGQQPTPVHDAARATDAATPPPLRSPSADPALALATRPLTDALVVSREPDAVLADNRKAAAALRVYMDGKTDVVMMGGERYMEIDDWQAIGHFFGLTSALESDAEVKYGPVAGFEATYVIKSRDGRIVARETSMCCNDEEKWCSRPTYRREIRTTSGEWLNEDNGDAERRRREWNWIDNPKKQGGRMPEARRVKGPDMPVPLFQLRSMAHTRAQSKAYSACLRFVPTLLGFKTTPAEELPHAQRVNKQTGVHTDITAPDVPESWEPFVEAPPDVVPAKPRPVAPPPAKRPARQTLDLAPKGGDVVLAVGDPIHGHNADRTRKFTRWSITFRNREGAEVVAYAWAKDVHTTDDPPVVTAARRAKRIGAPVDIVTENMGTRIDIMEIR
jgi:hypothetical protein